VRVAKERQQSPILVMPRFQHGLEARVTGVSRVRF
jgi:hypothetical protein